MGGVVTWEAVSARSASAATLFVPGTAQALAQGIVVAPTTGGLNYAITLAQSLANYQVTEAQAQAQTLSLGAIGLSLTSDQCNGNRPLVKESELPQPATAESTTTDQDHTVTLDKGLDGSGAGAGVETAATTTRPSAEATTTLAGLNVPGGFSVGGVTATASAAVVDADARQARSSAVIGQLSLDGGAVSLGHLVWSASQRTGVGAQRSGSFTVGSLAVHGVAVPLPADSPGAVLSVVDSALAQTGFTISWPHTAFNPADAAVSETPLVIGIDNSALGREVVGSQLGTVQPLRNVIDKALLGVDCELGVPLLIGDIATGAVAGGGDLNLELGGAQAATAATVYTDPFSGSFGALPGTGVLGATSAPSGAAPGFGSGTSALGASSTGTSGGSATSASAGGAVPAGATRAGPTHLVSAVSCHSLGAGAARCGNGSALPVGLAGLGALGACATADVVRLRRVRRFQIEEVS